MGGLFREAFMKRYFSPVVITLGIVMVLVGVMLGHQSDQLTGAAAPSTPMDGNLILNPSFEHGSIGWHKGNWGSNKAKFSVKSGGHKGARSAAVKLSKYTNGDAKWYPSAVDVEPATSYTFKDWYKSTVPTEVDAVVTTTDGKTTYMWLADTPKAKSWEQVNVTFNTPSNAKKITFYHLIQRNGQLTTDDYDFRQSMPSNHVTPTIPSSISGSGQSSSTPHNSQSSGTDSNNTTSSSAPETQSGSSSGANAGSNPTNSPTSPPSGSGGGSANGSNSVPNSSVEAADPSNGSQPQYWSASSWGSNTPSFSYQNTGHTGNRSLKITMSNFTSGAANWTYTSQPVLTGHYRYTDWYKSDVTTEIDAAVTVNGVVQYYYLGTVLPSASWAQASGEFDVPAGATSITVFHLIQSNGYLVTDDFSFGPYTPAPFNRGIVSLTFDDGWANQYTNALPLMNKYGLNGTFYIISGELSDQPDYMSVSQINGLIADGNEIGSHTVTHPDLTKLTTAQAQQEMQQSQSTLRTVFGQPISNFAYPYGAYNVSTVNFGEGLYASQRTVDSGFNTKDDLDAKKLLVQNVFNTTTPAQVEAWVDQAKLQHTWLILVYHEVATVPTDPTDTQYDTQPGDLDAELKYIKNSGISVETVQQALDETIPQL